LPPANRQQVSARRWLGKSPTHQRHAPILGILTKTEIRDVVAYLASLKAKKK
jgi:hypothetical protein